VPNEHNACTTGPLDDVIDIVDVERAAQPIVDRHGNANGVSKEIGRLPSAELGAGDDRIGRKSALGQKRTESFGLALALLAQWAL
jgi:hypothetical protein